MFSRDVRGQVRSGRIFLYLNITQLYLTRVCYNDIVILTYEVPIINYLPILSIKEQNVLL